MMTEELDFEAEILVSMNVNEVEYSTPDIIKKGFVTENASDVKELTRAMEEVKYDTIGDESDIRDKELDTGDLKPASGKGKFDTVEAKRDTGNLEFDTEEIESDTGEIHSDTEEIPGDLEEGEIDDEIPVQTKPSEVACRFYQRGTCLYGSECRNLHISDVVYNMFGPILSNRSNFKPFELHNYHRPPVFQPNHLPVVPDIESSWERGIKNAKIVMENVNIKKQQSEDLDIENDWERCLEEAKAKIQKANFKTKTFDIPKPYFDSKYSKQEKFRKSHMKSEYESDSKEFSKQKYSKNFYSKYEKESNYKRTNPFEVKPTPDHLKWVDPWQRSKSPRKRTRSMSFSVSPSPSLRHSRDRSVSSSSSSSYFKQIYGSSRKSKSPRKKSRSPHSKKGRTSKTHTYSKKHSYSKSVSRSFSKSPRKRVYSGSSSSESSGRMHVRKTAYNKERNLKTSSRITGGKNSKQYTPSKRPNNTSLPSSTKSSFSKNCKGALSPSNSDSSRAGSYLSYTSVSSLSDIDDLKTTYPKEMEEKSPSKRDQVPQEKNNKETFKPNKIIWDDNPSSSSIFRRLSEEFDVNMKQKKSAPDKFKLQMPSEAITKSKSHSDKVSGSQLSASSQASKPTMVKKVTNEKPSEAAMELLMYHSFGRTDNKASAPALKPTQTKNSSLLLDTTKSKIKAYFKVPFTKESSNNTPNVQSKSQPMKVNTCAPTTNVKKEAVSKRNMLLQQLQAIEDAIARKKQPTQ